MKKILFCLLIVIVCLGVKAQKGVVTVMDPLFGVINKVSDETVQQKTSDQVMGNAEIIWQDWDPAAIGAEVYYSDTTHKILVNWTLNDPRLAQYNEESNIPEWEFLTNPDNDDKIFSNEKGNLIIVLDVHVVYMLDASGETVNTININGTATACAVRADGQGAYIAVTNNDGLNFVEYYNTTSSTAIWSKEVDSQVRVVTLSVPENDARLAVCFPQPLKKIYVLNTETGETIQDNIYYYDNTPSQAPAFSDNGDYMVFTDVTGYATLMHWDGEKYEQVWRANLSHTGQTSRWGCGNAISADGYYIAIGTMGFVASGGYDGSIFLFNNESSIPIWEYWDAGDMVSYISMSDDGSLIACASWGPEDNSTSDLLIFRRQSNEPFVELNTPGSMNYVDIAGDGSTCIVAGKAVHKRVFGMGGYAYFVHSVPTTCGTLSGMVTLSGANDYSGVRIDIESLDNYYETTATDGSFTLKYIPEGTYSVMVSKTGYYSQQLDNIVITAGDTSNINVTLEPVGSPISNLFASKGASYDVQLRWDAYQDDFEGYAIYRKESFQASYSEPIAIIGPEYAEYIDDSAIPTRQYYYAVTALLDDALETPFSNIDLGYTSTAFIAEEIDVYNGSIPNIDGVLSTGEYDDAFMVDVSDFLGNDGQIDPRGTTIMYFKVSADKLYVGVDNFGDTELSSNDCVALYIDDNNDGVYPDTSDSSEGNYWIKYSSSGSTIQYRPIYGGGGTGQTMNLENPEVAFSDATGHVVIEFSLEIGNEDYMINPVDNKSKLYLYVRSNGSVYQAYWPYDNIDTFDPVGYGTINFFVDDEIPPVPENLRIDETMLNNFSYIPIDWDMPELNDFDHFNVYVNSNSVSYEVTGPELILDVEENMDYSVFVTTVDHAGNESDHSETLTFHVGNIGVDEVDNQMIRIYPNPVSSAIYIKAELEGPVTVTLTDITGKMIKHLTFGNSKTKSIDVNNLQSGIYFVMIQYENTVVVRKFIKK